MHVTVTVINGNVNVVLHGMVNGNVTATNESVTVGQMHGKKLKKTTMMTGPKTMKNMNCPKTTGKKRTQHGSNGI